MAKVDLAKLLKQLAKQWKNTEPAEMGTFIKYDDGDYIGVLEPATVELSKASERLQIAWPIVFENGKYKGKRVIKFDGLDSELSISWVKALMGLLGIDVPDDAEDIPEVLEKFFKKQYKDRPLKFTLKRDGEFVNIFINGYAEEEGSSSSSKIDDGDNKSKKGGKERTEVPSKKEIKKMSRKEIKEVIEEHGLGKDIDPDDYNDTDELRDAVIEALA